jgi:phosphoribosyl-ATP pyrophosphohydrolase/phosphoribosyl-AMP cyclohydrolase
MGAPGAEVTLGPGVLVPCVVQDAVSGEVLMLAHVDDEALAATRDTGLAHFHSRSRDQLWQKGATSGHTMAVESLAFDCDGDTVLLRVTPAGPACHTGEETCFGPRLIDGRPAVMAELAAVIEDRRARQQGASYVAGILGGEREQAQRKVGEEAVEVLLAAPGSPELVAEVADLWFHSMLLLARDGLDPLAPLEELRRRRQAPR